MTIYPMQGAAPYCTNCYLVMGDIPVDGLVPAVLVDASITPQQVQTQLKKYSAKLQGILLTHGHHDHVQQLDALRAAFDVPVYLAPADAALYGVQNTCPYHEKGLSFGDINLAPISTPGHTPGSTCLVFGSVLFCGDTLFAGSVGRTDLTGGEGATLCRSLAQLVQLLQSAGMQNDLQLLCGHGPHTTLGQELATNPYLRYAIKNPDGSF